MDSYEAYTLFLALRAHFNQKNYNFHKYNGKIRTNYDAFLKRNDRFFFHKLSKKEDPIGYVISNILDDENLWITSLFTDEADSKYTDWKKRTDSMTYNFKVELDRMGDDFNEVLKVSEGQHPKLLQMYLEGDVSPETMVIINELTSVFKVWNARIEDEIVWPSIYNRLKKYREFMKIDEKKETLKKVIVDKFTK